MQYDFIRVPGQDEVDDRKRQAREDFRGACIIKYGYIPFNDEFFERNWPSGHRADYTTVSPLRDGARHEP